MKTSRIIYGTIFTAATAVVALPAAEEHNSQHVLGCSGGEGIQRLKFTSGDKLYDIFVPADSTTYTIAGPASDIKCVDNSAPGGPCVSCDVHVDYVQLMSDGQCEITITKDDGSRTEHYDLYGTQRLGFGTPGHPVKIAFLAGALSGWCCDGGNGALFVFEIIATALALCAQGLWSHFEELLACFHSGCTAHRDGLARILPDTPIRYQ